MYSEVGSVASTRVPTTVFWTVLGILAVVWTRVLGFQSCDAAFLEKEMRES